MNSSDSKMIHYEYKIPYFFPNFLKPFRQDGSSPHPGSDPVVLERKLGMLPRAWEGRIMLFIGEAVSSVKIQ